MTYRINPMDNLATIAARFGVPVLAVMQANQLYNPEPFHVREPQQDHPSTSVLSVNRSVPMRNWQQERNAREMVQRLDRMEKKLDMLQLLELQAQRIAELERRVRRLENERK